MNSSAKARIGLSLSALILASFSVFIRKMAISFSDESQLLIRSSVTLVFIFSFIVIKKIKIQLDKKQLFSVLSLGLFFGLEIYLMTLSINNSSFFQAIATFYIGFLISGTIASAIINEKITRFQAIASFITLCALAIVLTSDELILLPAILGCGSGMAETFCGILRKKSIGINSNIVLFFQLLGMIAFSSTMLSFSNSPVYKGFSVVAIVALLGYSISHFFLNRFLLYGFQNTSMTDVILILAVEIPITVLFGKIFFGENLSLRNFIAMILIMIGSIVSQINKNNKLLKPKRSFTFKYILQISKREKISTNY